MLLLTAISLLYASNGLDTVTIDPFTKLSYSINDEPEITTYEWKKWSGHHGLGESSNQLSAIKNLTTFSSRWLDSHDTWYDQVPCISGTNSPDLSWFDDPQNQAIVLERYPTYISQFGDSYDLIYCVWGTNWPNCMLPKNGTIKSQNCIPVNYTAAGELLSAALKVLYQNQSQLPKYFEPQNEPYSPKFGSEVSMADLINLQNEINQVVYNTFKSLNTGIKIGGPAMDSIDWLKVLRGQWGNGTLFELSFEALVNGANGNGNENGKYNYPLEFLSWHQFSSYAWKNQSDTHNKNYYKNFIGGGGVSGSLDLIESYTFSANGYDYNQVTKSLISEHGYAAETDYNSSQFSTDYLRYIASTTYTTDLMLYLERPESIYKVSGFYLSGEYSHGMEFTVVEIFEPGTNPPNDTVSNTGKAFYVSKLFKENDGYIIDSSIVSDKNDFVDRRKVFSLYNNVTNKLLIAIKDISWNSTSIKLLINGYSGTQYVDGLRVFWNNKTEKFVNLWGKIDINDISLYGGEMMILYNISYDIKKNNNNNNNYTQSTLCRRRYYSSNFSLKQISETIGDTLKIDDSKNMINNFVNGILRIGLSWSINGCGGIGSNMMTDYKVFEPVSVYFNKQLLKLSLKRIDNLDEYSMAWIAFEYQIDKQKFDENMVEYPIEIKFNKSCANFAFVTSVVAEIKTQCG